MHLELQATIFLPLAVWCLDRAFESGRWRDMAGFGASLVLQMLSGIYYAVFLATALAVAIPWRWLSLPPDRRLRFAKQIAVVRVGLRRGARRPTCRSTCRTAPRSASVLTAKCASTPPRR